MIYSRLWRKCFFKIKYFINSSWKRQLEQSESSVDALNWSWIFEFNRHSDCAIIAVDSNGAFCVSFNCNSLMANVTALSSASSSRRTSDALIALDATLTIGFFMFSIGWFTWVDGIASIHLDLRLNSLLNFFQPFFIILFTLLVLLRVQTLLPLILYFYSYFELQHVRFYLKQHAV